MLPVFLRSEAEIDVRQIHANPEQIKAGLGKQFLAQLRGLLERVEATPELYGVVWEDVRAARLRKFRYIVYHVVLADRVEVLAVLHAARDSTEWQMRA
ncbi:MAG TPA: type II toxin-antitoxin system RelE/ParE family toxin [Pirellulales bacterium]|jgi:toxin ParE1/3/4|nr:type II toxin-antitoxin system RelE/ParE family toxin [Pirellulales bacterium]